MIAALLTMLFIFSGVFAVAVIAGSWRQHGAAAMAISRQRGQVNTSREVRITTRLIEVRPVATILRPDFRASNAPTSRQAQPTALPVAA